jgi:ATPase
MIGVVHATQAIDALQRLIGRVELGLIPQIVDTVIYIEAGEVHTVYDVKTEVKVPTGLTEEDLARPVITIGDFETGEPAYEIYTFNRQVVTVPIDDVEPVESGVDRLARQEVTREIEAIAQGRVDVDLTGGNTAVVYVSERDISSVIGKGGDRITAVEDRLGIDIDVRTHEEASEPDVGGPSDPPAEPSGGPSVGEIVTPEITDSHVVVPVSDGVGETVEVQANGEYLFTATVGRGGEIQVSRGSAIAEELEEAIDRGERITVSRT